MSLTKHFLLLILSVFFFSNVSHAEQDTTATSLSDSLTIQFLNYDTVGRIDIRSGLAHFQIPKGFKYLKPEQSEYVLTSLWGNPPSESLGMIFPEEANEFIPNTWAIEISYEEDGHVKDDDAKDIDYDDLLKEMQGEMEEVNKQRKEAGYQTVELLGWASKPYYDENAKKLHWAKKLMFEGDSLATLNYNIRILGRKGVLVLNAIGTIDQLDEINANIKPILASVNFEPGNLYADFNEDTDKLAAYGIGGLIAGGVLAKTGLLAKIGLVLVKFAKVIIVGVVAIGGAIAKFFTGKKNDDQA